MLISPAVIQFKVYAVALNVQTIWDASLCLQAFSQVLHLGKYDVTCFTINQPTSIRLYFTASCLITYVILVHESLSQSSKLAILSWLTEVLGCQG